MHPHPTKAPPLKSLVADAAHVDALGEGLVARLADGEVDVVKVGRDPGGLLPPDAHGRVGGVLDVDVGKDGAAAAAGPLVGDGDGAAVGLHLIPGGAGLGGGADAAAERAGGDAGAGGGQGGGAGGEGEGEGGELHFGGLGLSVGG